MKYDGIVVKIDVLYLFILDPDTKQMRDGINISDHKCYDNLKNDQIMVVNVIFKDGTREIDKIDLDEFIYGDSYGVYNTFLCIYDLNLFSIKDKVENIIRLGGLNDVALNCIELSKNK